MPFATLTAMGTLVFCVVNFLKSLTSKNWSSAITQLVAWAAGVFVVVLAAKTDYAAGVTFGDRTLDTLNGPSVIFLGLIASSILGTVTEIKKAIDTSDSAAQPPLIP